MNIAISALPVLPRMQAQSDNPLATPTTVREEGNAMATSWVDSHGDYLFNFAVGQVRDSHVAEDLVQETFLGALKSQASFSGRSSERTWLVGILRHKICDHLRRTCRERAVRVEPLPARNDDEAFDESLLWVHQVAEESMSASRRLELGEFRQHLERAMGKLPQRIAQVFQLYSIEDRSNLEVCERLNISQSNLGVMLHRARRQLRTELATHSGPIPISAAAPVS
jgi:RNA polymerase sigma-70 factor (TIGR02943 family)